MSKIDTIVYKYGFKYEKRLYCWKDKKLFSMPFSSGGRYYIKQELKIQLNGSTVGYFIGRKFRSLHTIRNLTKEINYKTEELIKINCPF